MFCLSLLLLLHQYCSSFFICFSFLYTFYSLYLFFLLCAPPPFIFFFAFPPLRFFFGFSFFSYNFLHLISCFSFSLLQTHIFFLFSSPSSSCHLQCLFLILFLSPRGMFLCTTKGCYLNQSNCLIITTNLLPNPENTSEDLD